MQCPSPLIVLFFVRVTSRPPACRRDAYMTHSLGGVQIDRLLSSFYRLYSKMPVHERGGQIGPRSPVLPPRPGSPITAPLPYLMLPHLVLILIFFFNFCNRFTNPSVPPSLPYHPTHSKAPGRRPPRPPSASGPPCNTNNNTSTSTSSKTATTLTTGKPRPGAGTNTRPS